MFHYGVKNYLQSIRDAMRYINTFSLKYTLLKDETNVIDLIGLTCIQVFEPNAYSMLQNYKKELCGSLDFLESDGEEKIKKAYDQITHGIINDRMDSAINILVRLFPRLNIPFHTSHVWGTPIHRNHPESLHSRSICNPHCFDRYFALSLEDEDIPSQTIEYLLFNATAAEFSDELLKINSSKRTTRLLEHFYAEIKAISDKTAYQERAKLVLKVLTSHWHLLEDSEDDLLFSSWFYHHLLSCTNALLEIVGTSERINIMRDIFADASIPLSTTICQLGEFEKWHNRFTDKKSAEKDALLTLEEVLELESVFVHRTIKKIESKEILDEEDFLRIIWFFKSMDENKASELTGNMISSNFDLARLVSACVSHGKAASKYVYKTWTVHKDDIQKYIDVTVAYERIKIFAFTSEFDDLPQVKKESIAAFLVEMEIKDEGTRFDDHIVISQIERKLKELEELNITHLAEQSRESL